jgi:hypothetical protein
MFYIQWVAVLLISACALSAYCAPADEIESYAVRDDGNDEMHVQFGVELTEPVDGGAVDDGTEVRWTLNKDITLNNRTLAPSGSTVIAHVVLPLKKNGARADKKIGRLRLRNALRLHFDRIVTPDHQELNIDGIPIEQSAVFNNGHQFRRLAAGENGEVLSAQDIDLLQVTEIGLAVPRELVDHKSVFNVQLKEGDVLKVQALINPSYNLSGKILKSAQSKPKDVE